VSTPLATKLLTSKWTKAILFLVCLTPLAASSLPSTSRHHSGSAAFIQHGTGDWTLRSRDHLAITPLRQLLHGLS